MDAAIEMQDICFVIVEKGTVALFLGIFRFNRIIDKLVCLENDDWRC